MHLTIFWSAFLLFSVQPIIGKALLPWFGGTAAVWTTCLVFFQVLLVLGYLYADRTTRLGVRRQAALHAALGAVSLLALPILPSAAWKPTGDAEPLLQLLLTLFRHVGIPYFFLSTTGPLLQSWYARSTGRNPYRLYALSNVGSLLALVAYPPVFEPLMGVGRQAELWSYGYTGFVILVVGLAVRTLRGPLVATELEPTSDAPAPSGSQRLVWVLLPACASALLLAVTNYLTQDVASIPFLWLLPLTLYLCTFIVAFDRPSWYRRASLLPLGLIATLAMSGFYAAAGILPKPSMVTQIVTFAAGFFVCALVCHGEVARAKPHPRWLTSFYLHLSVGGALGGLFVGLVAPLLFNANIELGWTLCGCAAIVVWAARTDPLSPFRRGQRSLLVGASLTILTGWFLACAVAIAAPITHSRVAARNFYGALRVVDSADPTVDLQARRTLVHGLVNHGEERLDPKFQRRPLTYYCPSSGVGRVLLSHHVERPRRLGVIGLGAGSTASYGRSGDALRYYEINPLVVEIARDQFHFLELSKADVSIILGDARLSLERETDQHFDILAVDAFSSDAIPVHLLTFEAFELYLRHLQSDGILALHISNRSLDLEPVLAEAARHFNVAARMLLSSAGNGKDTDRHCTAAKWVLMAADEAVLSRMDGAGGVRPLTPRPGFRAFTDDYSNLISVLKR